MSAVLSWVHLRPGKPSGKALYVDTHMGKPLTSDDCRATVPVDVVTSSLATGTVARQPEGTSNKGTLQVVQVQRVKRGSSADWCVRESGVSEYESPTGAVRQLSTEEAANRFAVRRAAGRQSTRQIAAKTPTT